MYEFINICEIFSNLPHFWNSNSRNWRSLKKYPSNLPCYFLWNSEFHKKNFKIFPWNSSTMENSNSPNSSLQLVVDLYIFQKQWYLTILASKLLYFFLFFAYYTETSVNEGCIHYKLVMSSHESSWCLKGASARDSLKWL